MKNLNNYSVTEISLDESYEITGGDGRSGWYYLMYGIGYMAKGFMDNEAHGRRLLASGSPGGAK
ncbi:hypothetical protein [Salegentibacter mishustinae]|jgi:hypothetical protein|uniref:Uncharacterized protein n=1 Tax=Salegentibacter mishustinae TaxID=270918 RepID=A0A0Q9Z5A7_9FLAO|nr:hypothetical protein [Salegentibacter mishustinae]KRG28000.1 hypothetical protein APR42_09665 [Salegentibacter mishustinae]PNW21070.1 hypothetical protein APB85_07295 [Salegentibacter mishustinae]PZX63912.1 hypothetical protein LY54_01768 [Salegentibacter mishustinae]GGW88895.1 hypothetical protein GCM10008086_17070 [Salegentibacter mishustinae]